MKQPDFIRQELEVKYQAVCQWILVHNELLAKQGSVIETWRTYKSQKLGPYFRLAYRERGRQRSIYLGRSRELADQVRELLRECQAPSHQHKAWQALRQRAGEDFKKCRDTWREELAKVGLCLKGNEARGWRTLSLTDKRKLSQTGSVAK